MSIRSYFAYSLPGHKILGSDIVLSTDFVYCFPCLLEWKSLRPTSLFYRGGLISPYFDLTIKSLQLKTRNHSRISSLLLLRETLLNDLKIFPFHLFYCLPKGYQLLVNQIYCIFSFFLSLFLSHLLIFTFSILDCSNFSSLFPISPAIVYICCFESDLHFYNDYIFLLFCTLVPSTHSYLFVVLSFIHSSLEA